MELTCPQCGGAVRPEEADAVVVCGFCGSRLHFDRGAAVPHEVVPAILERHQLPGLLDRWLQDRETIGRPGNVSARLLYFPLWLLPRGSSTRIEPAAPLLAQPPGGFSLPAGDRKVFREEALAAAEVVAASVHVASLLPAGAPPPKGTRLVHVPYWDLSFTLASRDHRVWIDGVGGEVLPLSEPASAEARLDRLYSGLMVATFVALLAGFGALFAGGPAVLAGGALLLLAGPGALALIRRTVARAESP